MNARIMRKLQRYERLQREIAGVMREIEAIDLRLKDLSDKEYGWTMSMHLMQSPFTTAQEAKAIIQKILADNNQTDAQPK